MSLYTIDWNWTALDLKICLPILSTLVFFSIYWFTSKSKKIKAIFFNKYDHDQASLKHIFFTKYFGFFSMGIFPTIICLFFLPDITLEKLPEEGKKNLLVICPGFASDCVETLEEIAIQGKESFIKKGGKNYELIPCLNDRESHIKLFKTLVEKYLFLK